MNNLDVIKPKSFYISIPEGPELRDLCCYSVNKYSNNLVCHLDGACSFPSPTPPLFPFFFFGCDPKEGNYQPGFLKLNF